MIVNIITIVSDYIQCNLSVLKSMKLSIKFDTNFIKYLISINKNINSYFYCRQYRLLVLNKGQLSLL